MWNCDWRVKVRRRFSSLLDLLCSRSNCIYVKTMTIKGNKSFPTCSHCLDKHYFFFLNIVCVKVLAAQSCPTLFSSMDCSPPGSSVHGVFPGKNTGVDSHSLLQGIFPTEGFEAGSPALQADSLSTLKGGRGGMSYISGS